MWLWTCPGYYPGREDANGPFAVIRSAVAAGPPQDVAVRVGHPGEDEEQVGEPVEVAGGERVGAVGLGFDEAPGTALGASGDDIEALRGSAYPGGGTVGDKLTNNVATIGENQQLRRMKSVSVTNGVVVPYVHNAAAPSLGKIGVLVALESEAGADVLEPLGKQIAMHIAAAFPQALSADDLDPVVLERERKIALEKAIEEAATSGKTIPEDILAKRADGAAAKFAKENALLSQVFVMDNKTPVAQVVEQAGKAAGTKIVLKDYVRFQLGEGIEKEESDFAAEVAAAAGIA